MPSSDPPPPALRPSAALNFQVAGRGRLLARSSLSRRAVALEGTGGLEVILAFDGGATVDEAHARLTASWQVSREALEAAVEPLQREGLLVPAEGPATPGAGGFADLDEHVAMLGDAVRLRAYAEALRLRAPGRRVLDLGSGTGVLAVLAARAGAREVIAVEETEVAALARRVADASGVGDRVSVVSASSRDLVLDAPVDLVVHELFGCDPLAENVVPTLEDARARLLRAGGGMVPSAVALRAAAVTVCPTGAATRRAIAVGRGHGVDLAALLPALRDGSMRRVRRRLAARSVASTEETVWSWDFERGEGGTVATALRATRAATVRGLALWFEATLAPGVTLATHPAGPPTHWGWGFVELPTTRLAAGDALPVAAAVEMRDGREQVVVRRVTSAGRP